MYTIPIAKQHNELLSNILLLLLARPIYLGICLVVHLNTHSSIYEQVEVCYWNWWRIDGSYL